MAKKTGVELEFSILDDDFKKAIKEMNTSIASMRKELQLENEILKGSNISITDYQNKLNTLKNQQELAKNKVIETSNAYEKAKNLFGENSKEAAKYKDALIVAQTEHQKITNEISKTTDAMKNYESQVSEAEQENKNIDSTLSILTKTISEQKEVLSNLKSQYVNTVLEQGKGSDVAKKLKNDIKILNGEIIDNEKKLNNAESELKEFSDAEDDAGKHAITFGEMIKANLISEAIINGVKSLASGIKSIVTESIGLIKDFGTEYQQASNQMQVSLGLTNDEMKEYDDVMKRIYSHNYGENFNDIANAISVANQNLYEFTPDQLESVTESALALRDTFDLDVSESMRSAKAMMTNLGTTSEGSFNLIVQGMQNGLNYSGELIDNINEYSVQFGKLGFSASDMFNIFQSGADAGAWNLDKIGDAVKEFSIRAIDGSKTTIEGFTKLGFNADEMAKKFASGGDVAKNAFYETIEAIKAMDDPVKQSIVGVDLFGTMWEDLGPEVVTQLGSIRDLYNETNDSMEKLKEIKYDDLGSAFEGIGRQLKTNLILPISDEVLPLFNQFANDMQSAFGGEQINFDQIGVAIGNLITNVSELLINGLPQLTSMVLTIIQSIGNSIMANIPLIVTTVISVLQNIITTILGMLPQILQAGIQILISLAQGISQALPELVPTLVGVILEMVNILTNPDNLMNIINAALTLISSLAEGIINAIPVLVEKLPQIIDNIVTFFTENLDQIIDTGVEMIVNLAMALVDAIPIILENLPKIIMAIVNGLLKILPKLATAGLQMMVKLGAALIENIPKIVSKIPQIIKSIINGFGNLLSGAVDIGKNFVTGLWNGINNAKDWIIGKIKGFKDSVLNGIKSFFGIHSPSTVFRDEVGKNLALGLGLGFTDEMKDVTSDMQDAIPTNFDVGVNANSLTNGYSNNLNNTTRSISDTSDYNPGEVVPIYLTIENFNNNREQDIEDLSEEMAFYQAKVRYGKGTATT